MTAPRMLTTKEVAELVGVAESSIRTYRIRKTIPEPTGYLGQTPWWSKSVIDKWKIERKGRGRPRQTEDRTGRASA